MLYICIYTSACVYIYVHVYMNDIYIYIYIYIYISSRSGLSRFKTRDNSRYILGKHRHLTYSCSMEHNTVVWLHFQGKNPPSPSEHLYVTFQCNG